MATLVLVVVLRVRLLLKAEKALIYTAHFYSIAWTPPSKFDTSSLSLADDIWHFKDPLSIVLVVAF